jgi:hypothetical protein
MRRAVGAALVLLMAVLVLPADVAGQSEDERGRFRLRANHPDPFTPGLRIPFELDEELFEDAGVVFVTLRVKDLLGRFIATPLSADHPDGAQPVEVLEYEEPGAKVAFWDGTDRAGRRVPPAAYLLELVVNGERAPPIRVVVP